MTDLDAALEGQPISPPTLTGAQGRKAPPPIPDPARQRRNRGNRGRGQRTSRDLAKYLGPAFQNVEGMLWPWDVQSRSARIQSKRDLLNRGPVAALGIIEAIPAGIYLRCLYHVPPRARLATGTITVLVGEWRDWHGDNFPIYAAASFARGVPLLSMTLPVFRDFHVNEVRP